VYAERKGVLRIPSAALRFRPPEELLSGAARGDAIGGKKKKKHKAEKAAAAATLGVEAASTGTAAPTTKSVWALDGDKLKEVPVEIGVSDGSKVEVMKGALGEGDVLITDAIAKGEGSGKKKGLF